MNRLSRRPSPAMVVATIALILGLGGSSAYAAKKISGKDIKKDSISTKHVKNGTLKSTDFAAGQLPAGPAGPAGPSGARGAQGPAGVAFGVLDYNVSAPVNNGNGLQTFVGVDCDAGMRPIGGGVVALGGIGHDVNASFPTSTGWGAWVNNATGANAPITAYVICAYAGSVTRSASFGRAAATK